MLNRVFLTILLSEAINNDSSFISFTVDDPRDLVVAEIDV
jgi:hypothetical protein